MVIWVTVQSLFYVGIDVTNPNISKPSKPVVQESELSHAYWQNAKEGRFVVQSCSKCGLKRHYPRFLCSSCLSDTFSWENIELKGSIHSWTVCHHAFHPGFIEELPYCLVTVDMSEPGIRAMGIWRGHSELKIGLKVTARFDLTPEGRTELIFF